MKGDARTSTTAAPPPVRSRAEVEAMIRKNLPLVQWTIAKYGPARINETERDELFAHCLVGLWYAVEQYDPSRGAFSTHAVPKIRGRLTGWLVTQNRKKRRLDKEALSLSSPLRRDEGSGLLLEDVIADEKAEFEDRIIAKSEIERLLSRCTERERRIVEALGQGLTLQKVGEFEGVSRERIRQIKVRAMKKIAGSLHTL
jgi:RNA polymerase sigma factor (sigma-70 family)